MKTLMHGLLFALASVTAYAGVYHNVGAWPNNEVSVCFAADQRRNIRLNDSLHHVDTWPTRSRMDLQKWVEEEYSPARTGIHFTGFKDCDESNPADVPLFFHNANRFVNGILGRPGQAGKASLGASVAPGEIPSHPHARGYVWLSRLGFSRATVIHEFGHVARLRHEHNIPEALQDPRCDTAKFYGANVGVLEEDVIQFAPYDANSIMSYCNLWLNPRPETLSPGDLATLRFLYLSQD